MLIEKWVDQFAQTYPDLYEDFSHIPHYLLVESIFSVIRQLENHSLHEELYRLADYVKDKNGFHQLLQYVITESLQELQQIKQEEKAWEVSDLIRKLYELQEMTDFLPSKRYRLMMVDEFQDTDYIQVQFLGWLEKKMNCNLFVVGDVKRSIYRFRGADYTAFEQLRQVLEPHKIQEVRLVKNYCSSKKLLQELDQFFQV